MMSWCGPLPLVGICATGLYIAILWQPAFHQVNIPPAFGPLSPPRKLCNTLTAVLSCVRAATAMTSPDHTIHIDRCFPLRLYESISCVQCHLCC